MAKKLTGRRTKLDKLAKESTKKTRELMVIAPEKKVGSLKRRTFMFHDDDIKWLEKTTETLKNKSSVWSISKSALVRLGISLLRDELEEKDINEILERIKIE